MLPRRWTVPGFRGWRNQGGVDHAIECMVAAAAEPVPRQRTRARHPAVEPMELASLASTLGLDGVGGAGRCPAGEQPQSLRTGRAGLGGVDHEDTARIGSDNEFFVGESEFANHGMVESFRAGPVGPNVMRAPQPPEYLAARGQLANEIVESFVMGVTAGLGPHDRHAHLSEEFPVRIKVAGCRVEELEPGEVWSAAAAADEGRIESPAELIRGEEVLVLVPYEGNAVSDRTEHPVETGSAYGVLGGASAGTSGQRNTVGRTCQVEEVGPFSVVEEKGTGDGVKHRRRGSADSTTFQLGVVLDADVSKGCNFGAAKSGNASVRPGGKSGLFGAHLRAA